MGCSRPARRQTAVDLELVIAVDVSLSMDLDEQRLQRDGYVAAFRDPEVHKAITRGRTAASPSPTWSGPARSRRGGHPLDHDRQPGGGTRLRRPAGGPPISRARMTSISAALKFSRDLFDASGAKGVRRVIDVSGDGPNNAGVPVVPVRDELVARASSSTACRSCCRAVSMHVRHCRPRPLLRRCVIGGPARSWCRSRTTEFQAAIRRKLLLEIAGVEPPARLIRVQTARRPRATTA